MRAGSIGVTVARHVGGVGLQALLIVGIVAALLLVLSPVSRPAADLAGTGSALAGRSGAISVPDGVFAGTTTATVNPGGSGTWAYARCYQGGVLVYAQYVRVNSANQATFTLGPTPMWTGGGADCTAEEGSWSRNNRWRSVASTAFQVSD